MSLETKLKLVLHTQPLIRLDFDYCLEHREKFINCRIFNNICKFLKDKHVDFLVFVGPLKTLCDVLSYYKNNEEDQEISPYLNDQNQLYLFADTITSTRQDEELNILLIVAEVHAEIEVECKSKVKNIISRMEMNRKQKAIFVNPDKTILEEDAIRDGRGAVMHIDERERYVLLTYLNPKVALYKASFDGNIKQATKLLANGVEVNSCISDENNRTAMHAAVENGHKNVVLLLLAHGADIFIEDNDQQKPIDLAINNNNNIELRKIFRRNENEGNYGNTSLHMAARSGNTETVKMLVETENNNINAQDNFSYYTPLYLAAYYGHDKTAETLIDLGANLNLLCSFGDLTVLDIAKKKCKTIVVYLMMKGAKTSQQVKSETEI